MGDIAHRSFGESNEIRTSDPDWIKKGLMCYANKTHFVLIDDARVGISQDDLTSAISLIKASPRFGIARRRMLVILTAIGFSAVGIALIIAAIIDPEPTSKLGILLGGGVVLIVLGEMSILWSLGLKWNVKRGLGGTFEVNPS